MNAEALSWIERQKPDLVAAAETYVADYKIFVEDRKKREAKAAKAAASGRKPKDEKIKPRVSGSQLRNLLSAAQAESSLAVLINFLRYQVGRGNKGWPDEGSGTALETLLKEKVGELGKAGAEAHKVDRHALEARLAALLLGYVIREYTFRCHLEGTSS